MVRCAERAVCCTERCRPRRARRFDGGECGAHGHEPELAARAGGDLSDHVVVAIPGGILSEEIMSKRRSSSEGMTQSRRDFIRRSCCCAAALGVAASFSRFGLVNALAQGTSALSLAGVHLSVWRKRRQQLADSQMTAPDMQITRRFAVGWQGGWRWRRARCCRLRRRRRRMARRYSVCIPTCRKCKVSSRRGSSRFSPMSGRSCSRLRAHSTGGNSSRPVNLVFTCRSTAQWQTSELDGFPTTGWAGRVADNIQPLLNGGAIFPPITSVAGTAIFCTGQQTQPYAIIPGVRPGLTGFNTTAPSTARLEALQQLLTLDTGVSMIQSASSITSNSLADSKTLSAALARRSVLYKQYFPTTGLGAQLLQVAQILKVRAALGLSRQVFFCSLGGFDTHSNQIATQETSVLAVESGGQRVLQRDG